MTFWEHLKTTSRSQFLLVQVLVTAAVSTSFVMKPQDGWWFTGTFGAVIEVLYGLSLWMNFTNEVRKPSRKKNRR